MKTIDEKLDEIIGHEYLQCTHEKDVDDCNWNRQREQLKALLKAEMLEIIGEDDTISGHEPLGNIHAISNYRRQQQRVVLNEKLGREDKQPIWDALNNSDA